MKPIPPRLTAAERENEKLKLELEETKAKLAVANNKVVKLEAREASRLSTPAALNRRDSAHSTASSSSRVSSTPSNPSYARATAASASKNRSGLTPRSSEPRRANKATVQGTVYYYVDGHIAAQEKAHEDAGYLRHTYSSAQKTSDPWFGVSYTNRFNEQGATSSNEARDASPSVTVEQSCALEKDDVVVNDFDPNQIQTLKERTRLWDTSFYSTPAGQVHLHLDLQLHFLKKSYGTGQDALFIGLRRRCPEAQKSYYRHGPRSVKFGRDEINSTIGNESLHGLPPAVHCAVMSMVYLRNAVAHPKAMSLSKIDSLMQHAQLLACSLGNDNRAAKIRRLRDELQKRATQVYKDILAYEPHCHLPKARSDPLHHQELFGEVYSELRADQSNRDEVIARFGPEVFHAMEEWRLRRIDPGLDDPEYVVNVEKYKIAHAATVAKKQAGDEEYARMASQQVDWPAKAAPEYQATEDGW